MNSATVSRRAALKKLGVVTLGAASLGWQVLPALGADRVPRKGEFTLVIIPDTHFGLKITPEDFRAIVAWVLENSERLKIKFVAHLGDIVDNIDSRAVGTLETRMQAAREILMPFGAAGMPFLTCTGNHDYLREKGLRNLDSYNRHIGSLMNGQPWVAGSMDSGRENTFFRLDIDGTKFLMMALEFGPRDRTLAWANDVLSRHADHEALIFTHCYLNPVGKRTTGGERGDPRRIEKDGKQYAPWVSLAAGPDNTNDAEGVWHKCLKRHANVRGVWSGHHLATNMSHATSVGDHGQVVHEFFQNWQNTPFEGRAVAATIRLFRFDLNKRSVRVENFVPPLGKAGVPPVPAQYEYRKA